jgi:hypothetical protein
VTKAFLRVRATPKKLEINQIAPPHNNSAWFKDMADSSQELPPPLPPRPKPSATKPPEGTDHRAPLTISGPTLQAKPTTALSLADANTASVALQGAQRPPSRGPSDSGGRPDGSDADETMSVRSLAPTNIDTALEAESMLGDVLEKNAFVGGRLTVAGPGAAARPAPIAFPSDAVFDEAFECEFNELDDITSDGLNEEAVLKQWKSKLKHYFVLSAAGKPIWTRHGNDRLVTSYIGVIQTLISFYEGASDSLKGFTAGDTRFVVLTKGSLYLVAISRLPESDQQLRAQLEALYMQILSTLTLPVMTKMFKTRASMDLRRPLQGTERLLSALADGFTRGAPSTLLSALECLKMRKAHRSVVNNSLLKLKSENLLYGMIATGGRLVSVVRPRKHSLHPGDLHLIFNMLFEAGGVKASEGENWIPLCLPGFNNTGYVYMYVSFLPVDSQLESLGPQNLSAEVVAVILISANKEAFFELQEMKVNLIHASVPTSLDVANLRSNSRRTEACSISARAFSVADRPVRTYLWGRSCSTFCTNRGPMFSLSRLRSSQTSPTQFRDESG